jgi:hypothetical protein
MAATQRGGVRLPRWSPLAGVLLLGLLIREGFSFWTGHPYDFEVWIRTGHAVAAGQNPYSMNWPAVPGVSIAYPATLLPSAAYLPFWPLLTGGIYRLWEVIGGGNRWVLYLLLKQPGIWADVATAWMLHRLTLRWTGDAALALAAASFWSFFPYAILVTAIWGQFDSIAVLVVLATLTTRGPIERNLLWGIGILVKWLTAIFLPFEFFRGRGIRRVAVVLGVAVPLGLTALVFLTLHWGTVGATAGTISQSHGGGYGMTYAYILSIPPFSGDLDRLPILYAALTYLWIPGVLIAGWFAALWVKERRPSEELRATMLVLTVFLLLRWGLYEQYMLYIFSLLALDFVAFHPGRRGFAVYLFVLSFAELLVNNDLGIRYLAPLSPGIWPYAESIDATGPWAVFRYWALLVFAVVVTVSLIQLIYLIAVDDPAPRPWLLRWASRRPEVPPAA